MNKKNYLKEAIKSNIFDKDAVLRNAFTQEMNQSEGLVNTDKKIIYIKESNNLYTILHKSGFLKNLIACILILAMITVTIYSIQKVPENKSGTKKNIYRYGEESFDEVYNNLNKAIYNTLNVDGGIIYWGEKTTYMMDTATESISSRGNMIFNKVGNDKYQFDYNYIFSAADECFDPSGDNYKIYPEKDNNDQNASSFQLKYISNILYGLMSEYSSSNGLFILDTFTLETRNKEFWHQLDLSMMNRFFDKNYSGMKVFLDVYHMEKNNIDSIEVVSDGLNILYNVAAGSENILYTVNTHDIICVLTADLTPYNIETFTIPSSSIMKNPYTIEKTVISKKIYLTLEESKDIAIEIPYMKTDLNITDSKNNIIFDKYDLLGAYNIPDYSIFQDKYNIYSVDPVNYMPELWYLGFELNDNGIAKLETVINNYPNEKLNFYINGVLFAKSSISIFSPYEKHQQYRQAIYLKDITYPKGKEYDNLENLINEINHYTE